jgi:hypothetical protein
VDKPAITYSLRNDVTPEIELNALANVYGLVLQSAEQRGHLLDNGGPDDPERRSSEIRAKASLPR